MEDLLHAAPLDAGGRFGESLEHFVEILGRPFSPEVIPLVAVG
jgi:hypothetical protein